MLLSNSLLPFWQNSIHLEFQLTYFTWALRSFCLVLSSVIFPSCLSSPQSLSHHQFSSWSIFSSEVIPTLSSEVTAWEPSLFLCLDSTADQIGSPNSTWAGIQEHKCWAGNCSGVTQEWESKSKVNTEDLVLVKRLGYYRGNSKSVPKSKQTSSEERELRDNINLSEFWRKWHIYICICIMLNIYTYIFVYYRCVYTYILYFKAWSYNVLFLL